MPFFVIYAENEEQLRKGNGKLVYNSTQAAAKIGLHERKIRLLVKKGQLTPVDEIHMGVSPMYLEEDILKVIESRKKSSY